MLEYLRGADPESLLTPVGSLDLDGNACVAGQVLAAAHCDGVVDLDLKPANVVRCGAGSAADFVKLRDFGIGMSHAAGWPGDACTRAVVESVAIVIPA